MINDKDLEIIKNVFDTYISFSEVIDEEVIVVRLNAIPEEQNATSTQVVQIEQQINKKIFRWWKLQIIGKNRIKAIYMKE